jgi:hypothetical protein
MQYLEIGQGRFRREDIFKPISGNVSLPETANDNAVRVANLTVTKYLIVMSTMIPCHGIYNYTCTFLMERHAIRFIMS